MTGGGGWPMTVFMTPDGRPFFGGTYFPRPTFLELLRQVSAAWRDRRPDIERDADRLAGAVRSNARVASLAATVAAGRGAWQPTGRPFPRPW